MTISIIHISDLHLRENWHEEQGIVLKEFLLDLERTVTTPSKTYIVFTGDILQEGSSPSLYSYFTSTIGQKLKDIGFTEENIIFIPGNHDVDRKYTEENKYVLLGLQQRATNETSFNNSIYSDQRSLIGKKFEPFLDWQKTVSDFHISKESFGGAGFPLTDNIGIYCLNTAIYSFGGLKDENGKLIDDRGCLPVETRELANWLNNTSYDFKILAMHHPLEWLSDWAQQAVKTYVSKSFNLLLTGHEHSQSVLCMSNGQQEFTHCAAPQLFTSKVDNLGYSRIDVSADLKEVRVFYRAWAEDCFVTGTKFSKNDNGIVEFNLSPTFSSKSTDMQVINVDLYEAVESQLKANFSRQIKCYSSLPTLWVTPNISNQSEIALDEKEATIFSADELVSPFHDCTIYAPPQFGLTALGYYLAYKSWKDEPGKIALFIKSSEFQSHEKAISDFISAELDCFTLKVSDLCAIILDEPDQLNSRKINNIKKLFPRIPLVILRNKSDIDMIQGKVDQSLNHSYQQYFLLSFDRSQIRELTKQFNDSGFDLNEDSAVQRLVDDLETLNIHRTPLNCLTLLVVYARQIDFSPINRTDMFERFLYFIFVSYKKNPDYSTFPDMKDALAVLGAFCGEIVKTKVNSFSKVEFLRSSEKFCEEMVIDVDCAKLFDVLHQENIVVSGGEKYFFRYVHWIYFFAAHRMQHSEEFRNFVLSDAYYMNFPEIIEFFSGIDRHRNDLIQVLIHDLKNVCDAFEKRTKIGRNFDPYDDVNWNPSDNSINALKENLEEEAKQSGLPVEFKDKIADVGYDRTVPYSQEIHEFVRDSSLYECMQVLCSAARALRNSDFVNAELKIELMHEIMRAWTKEVQVLFLLSPVLANDRKVLFDNVLFKLGSEFDEYTESDLWQRVVQVILSNVLERHEKDIASPRMGPLFDKYLEVGKRGGPESFLLISVIIRSRPRGWQESVKRYISNLHKNSYYLLKIYNLLFAEHKYGFLNEDSRNDIANLIGMAIAKHETGSKNPNRKLVRRAREAVFSPKNKE